MLTQQIASLLFRTEAEWLTTVAGDKKTRTFSNALTKARANNFYLGSFNCLLYFTSLQLEFVV